MMAKDRKQRYRNPDDLIVDLECLLNGEPPKLARQRIEAGTLQELAEGEADEDERRGDRPRGAARRGLAVDRHCSGGLAGSPRSPTWCCC